MVENEKIEYALALNLSRFRKNARLAVGKVEDMDKKIRKSVKNSAGGFNQLETGVLAVGTAATAVAAGGLLLMKKGLEDTIGLANVQEDAEVKLAGVIRATGGAAGFTTGELKTMAAGFQEVTTTGDETVIQAQSVLATFKQIKGDQFRDATQAALDMQTVVGGDLQGSVTRLGKALNDPVRGVSALNRVGVTFNETQKATIKRLQQSGDIMGAQKVILNELESEFGGTAAALRGTFKGSVDSAANAWGDLYEQTGYAITKNEFFIESAKLVEQKIIDLTGKIQGNEQAMRDLAKKGGLAVIDGIGAAIEVVRFFYNGWQGVKLAAHGAVWGIVKGAELVIKGLRKVLFPLDMLLTGLEKIGIIDSNPLKDLEKTAEGFADHLGDEFWKKFDKVEETNRKFDAAKKKVADFRAEIGKISTEKVDVAQDIQDQVDAATKKNTGVKSYTGNDEAAFKMVDGVYQQVNRGPVKNTIDKFKSPVGGSRESYEKSKQADKVLRLDLPNGASLTGDSDQTENVIEGLQQAGLTAQ